MKYNNILETIGNTPHIRLSKLFPNHEVWIKLEKVNPGGSIKDRIAVAMIDDAEKKGLIKAGGTIIEPTSGNTGIGLSLVAALRGYKVIITMPESMSVERRSIMEAYGAEIVLTPREFGMKGAIEKAISLTKELENSWMPQQFENEANPQVHQHVTASEIIADFPDGFDYFVSGVGTGGHISGIGRVLKEQFSTIKVYAIEPELSPVINGGNPGSQGIGAGFLPENLDLSIIDKALQISQEEAFSYTRRLAMEEGILGGISTGASLAGIANVLSEIPNNSKILTINYDTGERYFSVPKLF